MSNIIWGAALTLSLVLSASPGAWAQESEIECEGEAHDVWFPVDRHGNPTGRERRATIEGDAVMIVNDPQSESEGNIYAGETLLGPAPVIAGESVIYSLPYSPVEIRGGDAKVSVTVVACTLISTPPTTAPPTTVPPTSTTSPPTTVPPTSTTAVLPPESTTTTSVVVIVTTTSQPPAQPPVTTTVPEGEGERRTLCTDHPSGDGTSVEVLQERIEGEWVTIEVLAPVLACTGGYSIERYFAPIAILGAAGLLFGSALLFGSRRRDG